MWIKNLAAGIAGVALVGGSLLGTPAAAQDIPNILVMTEDFDKDTVPRNSRVQRNILAGMQDRLNTRGYRVFDETAVGIDGYQATTVQGRSRRTPDELIIVARSANQPIDIIVNYEVFASVEKTDFASFVKMRISGRVLDPDSGRFVGSFEVIENLESSSTSGGGDAEPISRLTNYLSVVQERFPEYAGLVVLDEDGTPVAVGAASVEPPDLPAEWLAQLRLGDAEVGDPYWHDSISTVATTMAVPIQDADARYLGALVATLTFEGLREALAALAPGEAGAIEVLSPDGRVIVGTESESDFEEALPAEALERLEAAGGATVEYEDQGVEMVGTLTRVSPVEWSVITHLPVRQAYAPVTALTQSTILLVSLLLLVVGTAAWVIGRLITRPLDRLADAAGSVAHGDLSVDLPVTGRDEVASLTKVFNGMVARLRANTEALDEANEVLRSQNEELERLSMTDALTTLYNRRYVMRMLEKELGRAQRYDRKLSVLMMDIDDFKEYNDTYGHQAGDEVLTGMGEVLRDATREADVPARYGGEEFIVVLPDTDLGGAVDAAERVRERLDREVFEGGKVTVSIGAAEHPAHGESPMEVIAAADVALYAAKQAGRDRVVAAEADGRG